MKFSTETKDIFSAIVAAEGELKNPQKSATNPHFMSGFAPLDEITNDIRPVLKKHGLAVMQDAKGGAGNITVSTVMLHTSGQWVESEGLTLRLTKDDPQGGCAAVTYARRYALLAMLNIVGTDEDDDGNTASTPNVAKKETVAPVPAKPEGDREHAALVAIQACTTKADLDKLTARIEKSDFSPVAKQRIMHKLEYKFAEIEFVGEGK